MTAYAIISHLFPHIPQVTPPDRECNRNTNQLTTTCTRPGVSLTICNHSNPPARCSQVGVIRKLKYGKSLRVVNSEFVIDTTKQGAHKTSKLCESAPPIPLSKRFKTLPYVHSYGPSVTTISKLVQPWIKLYIDSLKFELKENDDEFYIFYVSRNLEKGMGSSQWCSTIKVIHSPPTRAHRRRLSRSRVFQQLTPARRVLSKSSSSGHRRKSPQLRRICAPS